jgi:predicted transcriptional regulator
MSKGTPQERRGTRLTSVELSIALDRRMRDYAGREGVKLRHIIEQGIVTYLDAREPQQAA